MNKSKLLNIVFLIIIILLLVLGGKDLTLFQSEASDGNEEIEHMVVGATDKAEEKVSMGVKNMIYPKPAMVISSYDSLGVPNMMAAAWFGVANSHPLKVSVSLRPATYSYHNITRTGYFTVNVPDTSLVDIIKYVGKYSGEDENKFEKLGLHAMESEFVNAPYVDEFPIIVECKVTEYHDIGSHRQFIGEVINTRVNKSLLDEKGQFDFDKFQPVVLGRGYYAIGDKIKN